MSVQTISTGPQAAAKMSARTRDRLLNIVSPLALLVLWELCARFGFIDTRFFPAPSSVVSTMIEMLRTGELVTHTAVSMQRLLYGAILGGVPALVLGIGIGLVLIAVAEMVGAKSGLGYLIWSAWSTFAVEQMYVGLFVIAIIGFLITLVLNELERVIIPWKAE